MIIFNVSRSCFLNHFEYRFFFKGVNVDNKGEKFKQMIYDTLAHYYPNQEPFVYCGVVDKYKTVVNLRKIENSSHIKPFEQTPNYAEFIGEMGFSSFKEMCCDTILLVEGVTEVKSVKQFLRQLGKDHTIVLIPLGGRQFITSGRQAELAELGRLSKKYCCSN